MFHPIQAIRSAFTDLIGEIRGLKSAVEATASRMLQLPSRPARS